MSLIDTKAIREMVARKRARGNISVKAGRTVSKEERIERHAKAKNTPFLDKMIASIS